MSEQQDGTPVTPDDLDRYRQQAREAKGRAEEATPGPWRNEPWNFTDGERRAQVARPIAVWISSDDSTPPDGSNEVWVAEDETDDYVYAWEDATPANLTFIAQARSDVPTLADAVVALADTVERQRATIEAQREAMIANAAWYARQASTPSEPTL